MDSYIAYFEAQEEWYSTRSTLLEKEEEYAANPGDIHLEEEIMLLRVDLSRLSKLMDRLAGNYEEAY